MRFAHPWLQIFVCVRGHCTSPLESPRRYLPFLLCIFLAPRPSAIRTTQARWSSTCTPLVLQMAFSCPSTHTLCHACIPFCRLRTSGCFPPHSSSSIPQCSSPLHAHKQTHSSTHACMHSFHMTPLSFFLSFFLLQPKHLRQPSTHTLCHACRCVFIITTILVLLLSVLFSFPSRRSWFLSVHCPPPLVFSQTKPTRRIAERCDRHRASTLDDVLARLVRSEARRSEGKRCKAREDEVDRAW